MGFSDKHYKHNQQKANVAKENEKIIAKENRITVIVGELSNEKVRQAQEEDPDLKFIFQCKQRRLKKPE